VFIQSDKQKQKGKKEKKSRKKLKVIQAYRYTLENKTNKK
jgi:hypothetical protein